MLWFWRLGSFVHVVVRGVWKWSKIVSDECAHLLFLLPFPFEAAAKSVLDVILTVTPTASGLARYIGGQSFQSLFVSRAGL